MDGRVSVRDEQSNAKGFYRRPRKRAQPRRGETHLRF